MMTFTRIFSKVLDYTWFVSLLLFFLEEQQANIWFSLALILLVPILFAPVEALLLKLFGTTLGKIAFGLRYEKKLSWKDAFFLAFQAALLVQPLLIPGVNFVFAFLYLKEWRRYGKKRWNPRGKPHIVRKFPSFFPYACLVTLSLIVSIFSFTSDWVVDEAYRITSTEKPGFFKRYNSYFSSEGETWTRISPDNLSFSILFPKDPAFREITRPVPKSNLTLHYQEYSHKDKITYTIGCTQLPKSWTKWGSGLVFKGAFHFLYGDDAKVNRKKKTSHANFPALEYEITKGKEKITGKLVLVKETLYKVEISQKEALTEEEQAFAEKFFASFFPK
ncbi:MAG: hypothetical protein JSR76_05385 [Verrucomicrobia bacterium]|nr:hypothetical protein [Verrucomicrobiota bacterium]